MKQINEKARATCDKFRALSSLNKAEYESLFSVFDDLVSNRLKHYTLKGVKRVAKFYRESRNSSLYGSRSKLDFILMYLKENPNQSYHGLLFEMCQSKVSEWIKFLLPLLESCL
ncbi:transposase family protein, partial [Dyadobacter sp. 3J3]|uniref:transposase family protein n=1 Tax=Dyadobacter sp. 3J3 TaxID=2606600 RepID=UPI00190F0C15